jgi:hypothetical protein
MRCPVCATALVAEQSWCLVCGAPARTRIAPAPNWRVPIALIAVGLVLSAAGLAYAFIKLSNDTGQVPNTTPTSALAPTPPPVPAPSASPPASPAATTPAATTPGAIPPGASAAPPAGTPTATVPGAARPAPTPTVTAAPPAPGAAHP